MKGSYRIAAPVLAATSVVSFGLAVSTQPAAAQAQRVPNLESAQNPNFNAPRDLKVATTISGNITTKNPEAFIKEFGQVKCSQLKVTLQESNSSDVVVNIPGQPQKSKFPDSYAPVAAQVTGNHLGLGCKFSMMVPSNAVGKKGYLIVDSGTNAFRAVPSGWQNPMPVPNMSDGGRNFVVELVQIK